MSDYAAMIRNLALPETQEKLIRLYGDRPGTLEVQTARYEKTIRRHEEAFHSGKPVLMVSAPGRTEIGGNHTDHNRGKVLAASVNLDTLAAVSPREDMVVNLHSEGYRPLTVDLSDLTIREKEKGTTAALIRGVAAGMKQAGLKIGGFDAAATSTVASGSGLSSSAAFEVMVTGILDVLYNGFAMDYKQRAIIGQYAENVYFGKPSGLLDQMASAAGGLVTVDFEKKDPMVRNMNYDFAAKGYALVVVGTGGSHADLTDHYAAIPAEMKQVAAHFGAQVLREVDSRRFMAEISALRKKVSDRAIMRALHFYQENDRVDAQVAALEKDDLKAFFREITSSGRSSFMYLQNVYAKVEDQSLSLALALAENMLSQDGAWRIHGGGFAGTTLNFVPTGKLDAFIGMMEGAFGAGCCHILNIRPEGAAVIDLNNN